MEAKSQATQGAKGRGGGVLDLSRVMIVGHSILVLYGHWAVNDPRGSGSSDFVDLKFAPLGPIHLGRKPDGEQPTRQELRAFHRRHQELLNFPVFWIDEMMRGEIAIAIEGVIKERGYTCYACAICGNHMHLVIRKHKDHPEIVWNNLADSVRRRLRFRFPQTISAHHPVISARPYKVYFSTPAEVWNRARYVESNPLKEGLAKQAWPFIKEYDNWPRHKTVGQSSEKAFR